jgi:anti-sigma factor RsiW
MNCADARPRLPALLYGDLEAEAARALRQHLAGCPACREEYAGLQQVRHALDTVPVPPVQVDLPHLYQEAARRQAGRLRAWRRAALACGAAAALLLLGFGLRLQVRLEAHQVVLCWGEVPKPAESVVPPPAVPPAADGPTLAEVEQRLQLTSNLIHALAEDLEARDAQQQDSLKRLQDRVDALQVQGGARWNETRRDIAALYAAQFALPKKGE